MGIYVAQHLKQMKDSLRYREKEIADINKILAEKNEQVLDLNRGIRALEALGDD